MTRLALITMLDETDIYSRIGVNLGPIALEAYLSRVRATIVIFIDISRHFVSLSLT